MNEMFMIEKHPCDLVPHKRRSSTSPAESWNASRSTLSASQEERGTRAVTSKEQSSRMRNDAENY